MGKYIKLFNTVQEYQTYASDISKFILPNVSLCEDEHKLYFNPFTGSKILCKYNVTSTESATQLLGSSNNFSSMIVDGVEHEVINSYIFNTTGEHTVLFTLIDGVTSIGSAVFYNCSGLTSVTIGNSVTSIGAGAFQECSGLTSVTIGNSVTSIGSAVFYNCSGLTSVTIGNSVTSIGDGAFQGCSGLTSVTIGNSVTSIGNGSFSGCSGLTSVTIGNSVTSIGNGSFSGCSSLASITCNAITAPIIQSNTFQKVKADGVLTVPTGSAGYDVWMGTGDDYLGKYGWTKVEQ